MTDGLIGKVVFVVTTAEDEETGEMFFTDDWSDLSKNMDAMDPELNAETRVFHGVLTCARYLPDRIDSEKAYVIFMPLSCPSEGNVVEIKSVSADKIVEKVMELMKDSTMVIAPEIDDFYVLYGYQMPTYLSVKKDDIAEANIETCKEIYNRAKRVEELSKDVGG